MLILTVLLPAAGIIVEAGIKDRRQQLEDAKHRATLMVESLAAQQGQIAAGTKQMLSTLAQSPPVQSLDAEACDKLLRELRDRNPIYAAIGMLTPDGNMFASADPFDPSSVNLSDRKMVKDVITTLDFSPGEYIVGRVSKVQQINYGYPVLDVGKRLIAIVFVGFKLSEYESFIKTAKLPPDSAVAIFDHQGLRLYRYPENEAATLGRPPKDGLEQTAGLDEGTFERKGDDGIYRFLAFKRLRVTESSFPYLLIEAGIAKEPILGKANFAMACELLILGLAAGIAACFAWFMGNVAFIRPINHLVSATQRFGSGEMGVRAGLRNAYDEFGKLAQSFDSMVELLEQRKQEAKKAEEELIRAFRKNDLILKAADEGIIGLDEKGTVTFANPAAEEMLGYEGEELIGKDLHPTIHHSFPDGNHYPASECPMWQCLQGGAGSRIRDEVLWKKDGTSFPSAYSSTPIIENGQVVGAVVTFRDISVRKRAEEALRLRESYLTAILENQPGLVWLKDKENRFLTVNHAFARSCGMQRPEEVFGKTDLDIWPRELAEKYANDDKAVLMTGAPIAVEEVISDRGEMKWFETFKTPVLDKDGQILGTSGYAVDITERKRAEETLRQSEELYRTLVNLSPDAISVADLNGLLTFASIKAMQMFGNSSEDEILGHNLLSWVAQEDHEKASANIRHLLTEGTLIDTEYTLVKKDGTRFIGDVNAAVIHYPDGTPMRMILITRDISERKRVEEALQNSHSLLASTLESTADGILVVDTSGKVTSFNRSFLKLWRIPEALIETRDDEQLLQFVLDQILYPNEFLDKVRALYQTPDASSTDEIIFKDGRIFERYSRPQCIGGTIVGRVWSFRDVTQRRLAEIALKENEAKFRSYIESAPFAIFLADQKGRLMDFNPAAIDLLGYDAAILRNMHILDLHPEDDREEVLREFATLQETGHVETEIRMKKWDGQIIWVSLKVVMISDRQSLGYFQDITERKRAEEFTSLRLALFEFSASHSLEELLRKTLDEVGVLTSSPIGFFHFVDSDQKALSLKAWSTRTLKEFCKAEQKGLHYPIDQAGVWVDCVHERRPVIHNDYSALSHRKGMPEGHAAVIRELVVPIMRSDRIVAIFGIGNKSADYTQGDVEIVSHAADVAWEIIERKRAEIALRASEERFSKFFDVTPVGTSISRLSDGQFVDVNDAFLSLFGYTREELIGQSALELGFWINPEHRLRAVKTIQKQGRISGFETQFRGKSGAIIDVLGSMELIGMAGEQYLLSIAFDITESKRLDEKRKKLEQQLFQAQKMESIGRLAGGVAHDFNNMLGVIIGRAELALNTDVATDALRQNLEEIINTGLRSADLTRQLLGFARQQTAAPKKLDLNDTISGMLKMLRRLIGEDIDLSWQPGPDLWEVKIDPSQVDQILANLAVNARDAISGVGAITMRTVNVVIDDSVREKTPEFIPGEYVLLTVSDTGAGMSEEVCENIFEPFFTTKEPGKGTGLGLSTVYGIVKQNDGFICVSSEPGKGATFKIYLPRFEAETAQVPSEEAAGKRPTGRETILLVEDDEAVLNLSKIILENLGYTVLAVLNPIQAIHLVGEHPGDLHLLITDVVMPEMNGRELAEQLRAIRPDLECLYMSGYTADVIADRGILAEGLNFIHKPFGSNDLATKVRQVLDKLK